MIITVVPARAAVAAEPDVPARSGVLDGEVANAGQTGQGAVWKVHDGDRLAAVVVVQVIGEVDLYTGPQLRQVLVDLLPAPGRDRPSRGARDDPQSTASAGGRVSAEPEVRAVVVDLRKVSFVDSFALGVLVHGHHLARPGGRSYALVSTSEMIRKRFQVTGLSRVMPLHPDLFSALAHLQPADPSSFS